MNPKNEKRKEEILNFVISKLRKEGVSPTTDEICLSLGLGRATVSKYISRLIAEGVLTREGRYRLSYAGLSSVSEKMPIIGVVACGAPRLATEDVLGYMSIDKDVVGEGDFFALVAEGNSMCEVGIDDGDLVYVRRQQTAEDGDIVVAMIEDEHTLDRVSTLKRFFRDRNGARYILHPENSALSDIIVDRLEIVGVAVRVLKKLR